MANPLPLFELELRIARLPAISRAAHLGAPLLHARRLVELWAVDGDDDASLTEAFRLLDVDTIAGVILRTSVARDYPGDPRHWSPPPFADMLDELRACAWQAALDGTLLVTGIKGVHGTRRQQVSTAELPRLTPDWRLSRLVCADRADQNGDGDGVHDEFIDVCVRRLPAKPIAYARPTQDQVDAAVKDLLETRSPDSLTEEEVQTALESLGATREQVRAGIKNAGASRPRGRPRK